MLLTDLFENLYRPLRLRGKSLNTTRLYGCTLRSFSKWLGYHATTNDLTDLTISRFLEHRANDRSPYTAEKERSQLLALWRFAADRNILKDRPCVPPGVLPERVPEAWTVEQLGVLFKSAKTLPGKVGDVPASDWWTALLLTLWETAERIGAIMLTQPRDFNRPTLLVRAEARKGKRRDRLYELSGDACDAIDRLGDHDHGPLFYWPREPAYLWLCFGDIVTRAGLKDGAKRCGFHRLRRSAASYYAAAGGDPTLLLDHANQRTTKLYYLDPRIVPQPPAASKLLPKVG